MPTVVPPSWCPPRIRTDGSNGFALHTMLERVPAVIDSVLDRNPHFATGVRQALQKLRQGLLDDQALPAIDPRFPGAREWQTALATRAGHTWLGTDWFFAEHYLYRQIADITEYWATQVDPFWPHKHEQYQSVAHAVAAQQADTASRTATPFEALSLASVFANRSDLSHATAHEQGVSDNQELLLDDRPRAAELLRTRRGPVHLVLDNAGAELTVDLFLTRNLLERLGLPVILHVKQHPAFVSDVVLSDVSWLLGTTHADASRSLWRTWGSDALSCLDYLRDAVRKDQLQVRAHEFWNGPRSLWEMPADLVSQFRAARLVILKGDAHYRRALGDALWPLEATFPSTTAYFPAPLLTLRTLKSDPVVGLCRSTIETLQGQDPTWRTNGQRGLACLGGQGC